LSPNIQKYRQNKSLEKLSPLQLYMKEVAKHPLLKPEEELELAKKQYDEQDVIAAHRLVTANLRLVVKIANDFRRAQISLLDLIQEGNYGLMQAVKRFNPYKGVRLSSYAAWWIRAYILKYIMDNTSQVKIATTAAQRKLYYNLRKETEKLLKEYDIADPKQIASNLDVREKDVIEMQKRLSSGDVSLDAPIGDEGSTATRKDFIIDHEPLADEVVVNKQIFSEFKEQLVKFKKTLKPRDLEVLELRVLSDKPLTLRELGEKYGVSRERARQVEAAIMKRLKSYLEENSSIKN